MKQGKKELLTIFFAIVIAFLLGLLAGAFYNLGYQTGRDHPRYIVHDTGNTFYFEYKD